MLVYNNFSIEFRYRCLLMLKMPFSKKVSMSFSTTTDNFSFLVNRLLKTN